MRSRCKLLTAAGVAALMVSSTMDANAAATLYLDDLATPGIDITIVDGELAGGPGGGTYNDFDGVINGSVGFIGAVGGWSGNFVGSSTKPGLGTATEPWMITGFQNVTKGFSAGNLVITFSDVKYGPVSGPSNDGVSSVYAHVDGNIATGGLVYETFVNSLVATTVSPSLSGNNYGNTTYGLATGLNGPNPPGWEMSQRLTITGGPTSGDATLIVPEPSTYLAGGMLLLPFAASTIRFIRKNRTA